MTNVNNVQPTLHKMPQIWFTADTHFCHKNILKHCPERAQRGNYDIDDVEAHDKWLIEQWNKTIGKKDIVYIVGDFAFGSSINVKKILDKLHGKKFLIVGNHDASSDHLDTHFQQITQIKMVNLKQRNYNWLQEDLQICLCHYPMVTWPSKHHGSIMVHGHCHGRLNQYNRDLPDLRVDVGVDSDEFEGEFVDVRTLYEYFKQKANNRLFEEYAKEQKEKNSMTI